MRKLMPLCVAALLSLPLASAPAAPVTLEGKYLKVGVGNSGALIDFSTFTGIKFDPAGTGDFSGPIDYLTPGLPFAFYSIGVNGNYRVAGAGVDDPNPFGATTFDLSGDAGKPFAVSKGGSIDGLAFRQLLYFDVNASTIHVEVSFKNTTASTLNNVAYAVGLDPDPDVTYPESEAFDTDNFIGGQGASASVTAIGPGDRYAITLSNTGGWANTLASVWLASPWPTDPYVLSSTNSDGGFDDNTINLGFHMGDFAAGQEKTIRYDYQLFISPVPEPAVAAMMLVGLCLFSSRALRAGGKFSQPDAPGR